jgi:hypothetical protein
MCRSFNAKPETSGLMKSLEELLERKSKQLDLGPFQQREIMLRVE